MQQRRVNFVGEGPPLKPLPPPRSPKRSLFFIVLIIFIGGCVGYTALPGERSNNPDAYDPVTLEPVQPESLFGKIKQFVFRKDVELAGEKDDRINILLLGMGGLGHDGPFLTDTIMIGSIKPSTGEIAMISIPRDLGVEIPGYGWRKINSANAYGEADKADWGGAFATEVIEETFDLDIQYYVRIDFQAFEEIVDEVGGITVNVERSFTDPLYPAPNNEYQTISFTAGTQTMDGERALQYARSRHGSNGEGSDFARAARQQKVILALKEKVLSFGTLANPVRIFNIVEALENHLTTNMEFADMIAMIKLARELNTDNIVRLVLDTSVEGYLENSVGENGAFLLQPKSGTFEEINLLIEHIFDQEALVIDDTPVQTQPTYSDAVVEIQNGTWRAGLAARAERKLEDAGIDVETIGNTEERPQAESAIVTISDHGPIDVLTGLSDELRIPIKESLPDGITPTSTTDIIVILGENFDE